MKVGVIGSGEVGQALANGFAARGHDVMLGSREPNSSKMQAWRLQAGGSAATGTFEETARFAEMAVLATLWPGTENALRLAGPEHLASKVVLDVTNPLIVTDHGPVLAVGFSDSGGEQVQRWLPESQVVKVYNIVNNRFMVDPPFPDGPPTMFLCGEDADAKRRVTGICRDFGWPDVVDIGGIEGARLLEPLAMLWIRTGVVTGAWNHAFKLLRLSPG